MTTKHDQDLIAEWMWKIIELEYEENIDLTESEIMLLEAIDETQVQEYAARYVNSDSEEINDVAINAAVNLMSDLLNVNQAQG